MFESEPLIELTSYASKIDDLLWARDPLYFEPPSSWTDPAFAGFDAAQSHQLSEGVSFTGRSIWGNRRMTVSACPAERYWTQFGRGTLLVADHQSVRAGRNSLDLGEVRVIEHALAITVAMRLRLDWFLTQSSFPFYAEGVRPVLHALLPVIRQGGRALLMTPRYPLAVIFENGAYAIALPDDGSRELRIDHEIDHKDVIGRQRMRAVITPGLFAFLCRARTNAYGRRAKMAAGLHRLGMQNLPFMGLGLHNTLIALEDRLLNPNPLFDVDGVNREFIAHQAGLDKLGSLGVLGEHFVGTLVTFRTSHAQDLQAMREIRRILMPVKSKS